MKKRDLVRLAASSLVCAAGAVTGLVMMVKSGKKIDESNRKKEERNDAYYNDKRN